MRVFQSRRWVSVVRNYTTTALEVSAMGIAIASVATSEILVDT